MLGVGFPDRGGEGRITVLKHEWYVVRATVSMTLWPYEALTWEAEVDFVTEEGLPFGLLGREGFLNHWAVGFNAYHGYFTVEPCDSFHARQSAGLVDLLLEHFPGSVVPP